jgi:hypothetical protein
MPKYRVVREFVGYELATIESESEQSLKDSIDILWDEADREILGSYWYTYEDEVEQIDG